MGLFEHKVAIVTGAAGDIGAAIARRFLAESARVALLDVKNIDLAGWPPGASAYVVNVCDPVMIKDTVASIVDRHGRIDVWVNNAGIYHSSSLKDVTIQEWTRVVEVNLTAAMLCAQAVAPIMAAQGGGRIINIASLAGVVGFPSSVTYCSTKAGLLGLTRAAALDLGPHGITVNAVCPGTLLTEMGYRVDEAVCAANGWEPGTFLKQRAAELPLRRIGTAEDVAGTVAFLASDDAAWMTGQALILDGGQFPM